MSFGFFSLEIKQNHVCVCVCVLALGKEKGSKYFTHPQGPCILKLCRAH